MKMLNKVCSVILVAAFLAAMFTVNVFALEEDYKYSTIAYFDGSGERVNAFLPGETLTAKVKVKNPSASETLMFVMLLYQNNELIGAECDTKAAGTSATEYSASLEIPADTTGVQVVSILWDNMKEMNAVCQSSIFPGGPADVEMIYLDGEPLAGFDPEVYEYTYPVEIDRVYAPVITLDLLDASAEYDVELENNFPGSSTITVTSGDGAEKNVYVIDYECDEPLAVITDQDPGSGGGTYQYMTNFNMDSLASINRDVPFRYMKPEVMGYDYIQGAAAGVSKSFYLNRSGNVMLLIYDDAKTKTAVTDLAKNGWTLEAETVVDMTSEQLEDARGDADPAPGNEEVDNREQGFAYVDWRKAQPNGEWLRNHSFCALSQKYTKHFDKVEFDDNGNPTDESVIVVQDNQLTGTNGQGCIVLFQYDPMIERTNMEDIDLEWGEYNGPTGITGITVDGEALSGFSADVYEYDLEFEYSVPEPLEVTCEVADGASYEVAYPDSFPGAITITVEDIFGVTEVYTINCTIKDMSMYNIYLDEISTTNDTNIINGNTRTGGQFNLVTKHAQTLAPDETGYQKVTVNVEGNIRQNFFITINPTDPADKGSVVGIPGTDTIEKTEDREIREAYDESTGATTYGTRSKDNIITSTYNTTSSDTPLLYNMFACDYERASGAKFLFDRAPIDAHLAIHDVPEGYEGCEYIAPKCEVGLSGGSSDSATFEFYITKEAEIAVWAKADMTVTINDTVVTPETKEEGTYFIVRYTNALVKSGANANYKDNYADYANLVEAYVIYKGAIKDVDYKYNGSGNLVIMNYSMPEGWGWGSEDDKFNLLYRMVLVDETGEVIDPSTDPRIAGRTPEQIAKQFVERPAGDQNASVDDTQE